MKTKELTLETVIGFMNRFYLLTFVDRNDSLDGNYEILQQCIKEKCADHLYESINDWYIDAEINAVYDAIQELKQKCKNTGYIKDDVESFFEENEDSIKEHIYAKDDSDVLGQLCRNSSDIPVRIELYSNNDCINSYWLESQDGFCYEESYFGDMVDALKLNPAKVKKLLLKHGEKVYGRFPDKKYRNDKELVTYEDFYQELENTSCGANLLTFTGKVCIHDLIKASFNINKVVVPKGNYCGIYSSIQGGGSVLEMALQHDITLKLNAQKYDFFSLAIDYNRNIYNYCIKEVYGVCDSFFGNPLKIIS
ncbi:MAG: hypothetical protein LBV74_02090 [Tannerella sp.]|jgi:hypothetical protein|nr:hypothetical protein [Tannerella sp.]